MNGYYYDVAVFLGFIMGVWFAIFFFVFFKYTDRFKLRRYYRMINDKSKKDLIDVLTNIDNQLDVLAVNTNTNWMKRFSNEIKSIVTFLRKKDVN